MESILGRKTRIMLISDRIRLLACFGSPRSRKERNSIITRKEGIISAMFAASLWGAVAKSRKNHDPLYYNAYRYYLVHFVNSSADSRIQQATNYHRKRTGYRTALRFALIARDSGKLYPEERLTRSLRERSRPSHCAIPPKKSSRARTVFRPSFFLWRDAGRSRTECIRARCVTKIVDKLSSCQNRERIVH